MYSSIWVFAGHTGLIVGFVVRWINFSNYSSSRSRCYYRKSRSVQGWWSEHIMFVNGKPSPLGDIRTQWGADIQGFWEVQVKPPRSKFETRHRQLAHSTCWGSRFWELHLYCIQHTWQRISGNSIIWYVFEVSRKGHLAKLTFLSTCNTNLNLSAKQNCSGRFCFEK